MKPEIRIYVEGKINEFEELRKNENTQEHLYYEEISARDVGTTKYKILATMESIEMRKEMEHIAVRRRVYNETIITLKKILRDETEEI